MIVRDTRTLTPQAQEELRRRVVAAVLGGMSKSEAARTFQVSRTSIDAWLRQHEAGGEAALAGKKRGRPAEPRLTKAQTAKAVRLIRDKCPDQLKLPFALWTREAVCELLEREFGIVVSVWTAGRYLKSWGFSPQKPVRRAYERDPKAVEHWLKVQYPAIAARAKRENALIHWGDEMGLRSDHQAGTSYAPIGKTPAIPGTGQRFGCNMISAITNRGQLSFMVFTQRFTAAVFITFLARLLRQKHLAASGGGGRKCFLIIDGHPVHRSAKVREWVAARAQRIELFQLPGYSPDLNPDECLNNDVKGNAGRRRPENKSQMVAQTRAHLRGRQRSPRVVKDYFREEHVRYAADEEMFNVSCSR